MLIFFLKSHQRIINRVSAAKVDIRTDFKESLVNRTIEKIKSTGCCNLLEISLQRSPSYQLTSIIMQRLTHHHDAIIITIIIIIMERLTLMLAEEGRET